MTINYANGAHYNAVEAERNADMACGAGASSGLSESGRLQPRHFRLELEAQLGTLVLGQPERHLRENGAV